MSTQKSLLHKNILLNKSKKKNILGDEVKIIIKNNMKSVNIPTLCFSNYFLSKNNYYKFVEKVLKRLVTDSSTINDFNWKGFGRTKEINNRLLEIHLDTYGYSLSSVPFLYRLSYKNNSRFQLYISGNSIKAEVIFVDLYHLLLPAADLEHGESVKDPAKHYNEVASYNLDLASIIIKVKELE